MSTEAIISSLERKGVENSVLNWYQNYLENRTCEATLGGSTVIAELNKGTPQGGCASPKLGWNCPYDDFLESYDNTSVEAFGFADDSKLVIPGIDFDTIFGIAQDALKIAETWARKCGVSFCPNKCAALFFTKSQLRPDRALQLNGGAIKWEDNTKYLGIFVDRKLNFRYHIESKITAARRKLMILRRVFEQTWGPNPKIIRWAYTGIVRPALTYGCVVWARAVNTVTMRDKLRNLQRLALLQIAGVRPSTPTAALELIYNVPPLDIYIWEVALKTAAQINIRPTWFPGSTKGHHHLLSDKLPALSKRCLDDNCKTTSWDFNYVVEIGDGKDITFETDWRCYTDGSRFEDSTKAGVGGVVFKKQAEFCIISYGVGNSSVYQAEVAAIKSAAQILVDQQLEDQSIYFMVDNQASLHALKNPESVSDSIRNAKTLLNMLGDKNFVMLRYIEAHKG